MKPQMSRQQHLIVAEQLLSCIDLANDTLQTLGEIYVRANNCFDKRENDIDPTTILLGLQAQFLSVRNFYNWLEAISKHTSTLYNLRGQEYLSQAVQLMDKLGVVIPDIPVL